MGDSALVYGRRFKSMLSCSHCKQCTSTQAKSRKRSPKETYSSYPDESRPSAYSGEGSFGHATLREEHSSQEGVLEKHVQHFDMLEHGPKC